MDNLYQTIRESGLRFVTRKHATRGTNWTKAHPKKFSLTNPEMEKEEEKEEREEMVQKKEVTQKGNPFARRILLAKGQDNHNPNLSFEIISPSLVVCE